MDSESKELPSFPYNPLSKRAFGDSAPDVDARLRAQELLAEESRSIFRAACEALGTEELPIVGYGSLINPQSAARTLSSQSCIERGCGVWVYGYRRIFDFVWPFRCQRTTSLDGSKAVASLNIRPAAPSERFNGVLYWISEDDFVALRAREAAYDLVPVRGLVHAEHPYPFRAYAWSVSERSFLRHDVTPRPAYYPIMWEAVSDPRCERLLGTRAADDYLDSTYLANGRSIREVHQRLRCRRAIY